MKRLLLFLLMLSALGATAQGPSDLIAERLRAQAEAWPREKLCIQPAADEYLPGEVVWLKVYLVDACHLWNISGSRYVYVELADPSGQVRTRAKLQEQDGLYAGYIRIPEDTGNGIHYLRAYTRYSEATPGGDALRPIQVGRPKAYLLETDETPETNLLQAVPVRGGWSLRVPEGRYYLVGTCRMTPFFFGGISRRRPVLIRDLPDGIVRFYALDKDFRVKGWTELRHDGDQKRCPVPLQLTRTADSCHVSLNMSALAPGEIADLSLSVSRSFHPLGEDLLATLLGSDPEEGMDMTAVFQGQTLLPPVAQESCGALEGRVETALTGRAAANAEIRLISPQSGRFAVVRSDRDGHFRFEGLDDPDGTEYVINATDADKRETVVPEVIEPVFPGFPPVRWRFREVWDTHPAPDPSGTELLEQAVVIAEAVKPKPIGMNAHADFSLDAKQLEEIGSTNLHDVLYPVPGVFFRKDKEGKDICYLRAPSSIKGDYPAALVIDGILQDGVYDLDVVEMSIVERIDVFQGGQAVIWGSRGGSGVISITTKKADSNPQAVSERFNVVKVRPLGYLPPAHFHPDSRTLYWNPSIRTDRLSFPLCGRKGEWRVLLQGVTSEGRIIDEISLLDID